jgi:hypothetical protein
MSLLGFTYRFATKSSADLGAFWHQYRRVASVYGHCAAMPDGGTAIGRIKAIEWFFLGTAIGGV